MLVEAAGGGEGIFSKAFLSIRVHCMKVKQVSVFMIIQMNIINMYAG